MARIQCSHCPKTFRTEGGLTWHLERTHDVSGDGRNRMYPGQDRQGEEAENAKRLVAIAELQQHAETVDSLRAELEELQHRHQETVGQLERLTQDYSQLRDARASQTEGFETQIAQIAHDLEGLNLFSMYLAALRSGDRAEQLKGFAHLAMLKEWDEPDMRQALQREVEAALHCVDWSQLREHLGWDGYWSDQLVGNILHRRAS